MLQILTVSIKVLLFSTLFLISNNQSIAKIEGKLEKGLYSLDDLYGINNIFFEKPNNEKIKYPKTWESPEITELIRYNEFRKSYIIRYIDDTGEIKYIVDSDVDLDFHDENPLEFVKNKDIQIADVNIKVQKIGDDKSFHLVNYQIVLTGKWQYKRVREYRYGEISIAKNKVKIMLKSFSGYPLFNISEKTKLLVDINQDGKLNNSWNVDSLGHTVATEKFDINNPFMFGDQKYEVINLIKNGTHLIIQKSKKDTAYAVGFQMPIFSGEDSQGINHNIIDFKGNNVLIEMWSISCPHCEKIRPKINSLIESYSESNFISIAIPNETNTDEVEDYLKDHKFYSTILYVDDKVKEQLNPHGAFPKFIMIDKNGSITFQGLGAHNIAVIESLLQ